MSASYTLRPASHSDLELVIELHRTTLKEYVEVIWGWDEAVQLPQCAPLVKALALVRHQIKLKTFSISEINSSFLVPGKASVISLN
jgi:hypothetical protein